MSELKEDARLDKSISLFNDAQQERNERLRVIMESSDDDNDRKLDKNGLHYQDYSTAKQIVQAENRKVDDILEGMDQKIL